MGMTAVPVSSGDKPLKQCSTTVNHYHHLQVAPNGKLTSWDAAFPLQKLAHLWPVVALISFLVISARHAPTRSVVASSHSFLCKLWPASGQSLHALCTLIFTSENTTTHLIMCSFPSLKGSTQL